MRLHLPLPKNLGFQVLLCTVVSSIFCLPQLLLHGPNIVGRTYIVASHRFLEGLSPYAPAIPGTDLFKYGLSFAFFFAPLSFLPDSILSPLWGFLNILVFWYGVSRWVPAYLLGASAWFWVIAVSMELDGSIRYQQINPLLVGLTLWGIAEYRNRKFYRAGILLSIATCWKVLPLPFLAALFLKGEKTYIKTVLLTCLVLLLLPAVHLGWALNWNYHIQWIQLLVKDILSPGILDIEAVLQIFIPKYWAHAVRIIVGVVTLLVLFDFGGFFALRTAGPLWVCLGLTGITLFNIRTEVPTFVFACPALGILAIESKAQNREARYTSIAVLLVCFFFLSLAHNDIWPRFILNVSSWANVDKTFAVLGLWLYALSRLISPKESIRIPFKKK